MTIKTYETIPQPVQAIQMTDMPSVWEIAQFLGASRVEIGDSKTSAVFTIAGEKGGAFPMNVRDWAIIDSENRPGVRTNEAFLRLYRDTEKDNDNKGNGQS